MKKLVPSFVLKEPNLASISETEREEFSQKWKDGMMQIIKQDDEEFLRYLGELKDI